MAFQIHALPESQFTELFALSDEELAQHSACRVVVDAKPGVPCRVSLADAEVGETAILLNYEHQPNDSPYRAAHAIFVRAGVRQARLQVDEVPQVLIERLLSVRAFDKAHQMIDADVTDPPELAGRIEGMFGNPNVSYLHLHYAKRGCFAASVTRA